MNTDHHAIVVGIDAYPGFSDLEGPCRDAEEMEQWLLDPTGGNVDPGNVKKILGTDFHPPGPNGVEDAHPIDSEIRALFRSLVHQGLANPFIGERLYIYMAGHGFSVADPARARLTALYSADAGIALAPNLVATVYAEWFRLNAVFREIVLIMDCCRTADMLHDVAEPALVRAPGRAGLSGEVRFYYAYATQEGQVARERDFDGEVRGIFTVTLLEALRKAPPNRLGRVTGSVIRDFVHNNIDSKAGDVTVEPPDINGPQRGEIVFAEREKTPGIRVVFRIKPAADDDEVLVFRRPGDGPERLPTGTSPVETTLPPGFYKARLANAGRQQIFEVGLSDVEITL